MDSYLNPPCQRLVACLLAVGMSPIVSSGASTAAAQDSAAVRQSGDHGAAAPDPHVIDVSEGVDFRVYTAAGVASSVGAILDAALAGEVLLIGEEHDDRVGHAVELRLLADSFGRLAGEPTPDRRELLLSLEMFEQDVQYVLDEYLGSLISEEHFLGSARPWDNYVVGYRPMIEFAKAHRLPVLAANAPRRYVSRVAAEGPGALLALSPLARSFLPPLPYPGPSDRYRADWDRLMTTDSAEAGGHETSGNAIQAQALWDASMAYAVTGALARHLGALVIHIAGAFHVARGTGIPERIADYRPGSRVTTVVMTAVDDVGAWRESEYAGLGDFVVLTATRAPR